MINILNNKSYIIFIICFIFLLNFKPSFAQRQEIKIISYNIMDGFMRDKVKFDSLTMNKFTDWVSKQAPDILLLQEMYFFDQKALEVLASKYNHDYAVLGGQREAPVAITSKYPIVNVQKVVDNMWHGYLYANVEGIHTFVTHLSPFDALKRLSEVKTIIAHTKLIQTGEKVLIAGDLNSLAESDRVQYEKDPDLKVVDGSTFEVINQISKHGFVDSYKMFNRNLEFKHSLPTHMYSERIGRKMRRIDYIWVNEVLKPYITSSSIVHDSVTDILSDHYPISIHLDISK